MKKLKYFIVALMLLAPLAFFTACDELLEELGTELTQAEVISGLREALTVGTDTSVTILNKLNGFYGDALIKIALPEEAKIIESTLRSLGVGYLVDDAILSMNRAAEDAAVKAKPIFVNAITSITISDGFAILNGTDTAATNYLQRKTSLALKDAFLPDIKSSLDKVGANQAWNAMITYYNQIPFVTKVNPDLSDHVTTKALSGLFVKVAEEEKNIRKNPLHRVSEILKKVFGSLDNK